MQDRHDQLELLACVEGELDAAAVAGLRRRLASEPRVLAALDRMIEDRSRLRAMPEPALPRDFLRDLEPLLARPMLIEPVAAIADQPSRPGEYRRQYRRQTRRIRWSRIAIAAILLIAVGAGTWAAFQGLWRSPPNGGRDQLMARTDSTVAETSTLPKRALSGTIHHHLPAELPSHIAHSNEAKPRASMPKAEKIIAEFAIVVRGADPASIEEALLDTAVEFEDEVALVRNFNFAEAQRLAAGLRTGSSERSEQPAVASARPARSSAELKVLADRVRQRLQTSTELASRVATDQDSKQLSGAPDDAPSLEQQLDFSSRGATHTISVPVTELAELLERLAMHDDHTVVLRALGQSDANSPAVDDALAAWMKESPQIRRSIEQLRQQPAHTIVLIPVIVNN